MKQVLSLWKTQLDIMEEKQHRFYIARRVFKNIFVVPNFWFLF